MNGPRKFIKGKQEDKFKGWCKDNTLDLRSRISEFKFYQWNFLYLFYLISSFLCIYIKKKNKAIVSAHPLRFIPSLQFLWQAAMAASTLVARNRGEQNIFASLGQVDRGRGELSKTSNNVTESRLEYRHPRCDLFNFISLSWTDTVRNSCVIYGWDLTVGWPYSIVQQSKDMRLSTDHLHFFSLPTTVKWSIDSTDASRSCHDHSEHI